MVNLTFMLSFLERDEDAAVHATRTSVLLVTALSLCNWIAAALPFLTFKARPDLSSRLSTCVATWHVLCVIYGVIAMTFMALPTMQTLQCCIVSFDNDMRGFTKDMDFNCPLYTCNYFKIFTILPFISIIWSTFSVHYQLHNMFCFLRDRQQEESSYDRLVQRLTAAHRDEEATGAQGGPDLDFNLDGIILANERRV